MTLILRKLLASSTFAIAGTLNSLITKLKAIVENNKRISAADVVAEEYDMFEEQSENG
jgi:hypothetical protein